MQAATEYTCNKCGHTIPRELALKIGRCFVCYEFKIYTHCPKPFRFRLPDKFDPFAEVDPPDLDFVPGDEDDFDEWEDEDFDDDNWGEDDEDYDDEFPDDDEDWL